MRYRVVTTVHAQGWEAYGRRMAQSVQANWAPETLPLILYAEGFDPEPMEGLEVRRLPVWIDEFKTKWQRIPQANGTGHHAYDYRFDAVKFAHKVAALTDAAAQIDDGVLIWVDADTFTHAPVDTAWLDSLGLGQGYMAWLDRANSHPECGFVMFRCDHPYHQAFMARFRQLYETAEVFRLRETHDSYVLQHLALAKFANGKIPAPVSLSGWAIRTTHPFINGPLGSRLEHLKGPRKAEGKSRARDLVRPRQEAYWNA